MGSLLYARYARLLNPDHRRQVRALCHTVSNRLDGSIEGRDAGASCRLAPDSCNDHTLRTVALRERDLQVRLGRQPWRPRLEPECAHFGPKAKVVRPDLHREVQQGGVGQHAASRDQARAPGHVWLRLHGDPECRHWHRALAHPDPEIARVCGHCRRFHSQDPLREGCQLLWLRWCSWPRKLAGFGCWLLLALPPPVHDSGSVYFSSASPPYYLVYRSKARAGAI